MKLPITIALLAGTLFATSGFQLRADAPTHDPSGQTGTSAEMPPALAEKLKAGAYNTRVQAKAAIRDLAKRQKVALNDIKTVRVESVTWPDGSLGCPQKGQSYTQAQVPGTLIVLSAGGVEHEYHAGNGEAPVYCENPQPRVEPAKPSAG